MTTDKTTQPAEFRCPHCDRVRMDRQFWAAFGWGVAIVTLLFWTIACP